MYCGSCLRDNALAAALLARGHDVLLTPVYTPTRTDERNVSQSQVFFGGISVFLEQQVPLKRELRAPICCTRQGEDLFLDGLGEPYRAESMQLIRAASRHVDAFLPVSQYYLDYMPEYLGLPTEKMYFVPLGINMQGFSPRRQRRGDVF